MTPDTHPQTTPQARARALAYQMVAGAAFGGPIDEGLVERLAKRIEQIDQRRLTETQPDNEQQSGRAL